MFRPERVDMGPRWDLVREEAQEGRLFEQPRPPRPRRARTWAPAELMQEAAVPLADVPSPCEDLTCPCHQGEIELAAAQTELGSGILRDFSALYEVTFPRWELQLLPSEPA